MRKLIAELAANMAGAESLYFAKPMVVLPIFWDQHDNAQRIELAATSELGYEAANSTEAAAARIEEVAREGP